MWKQPHIGMKLTFIAPFKSASSTSCDGVWWKSVCWLAKHAFTWGGNKSMLFGFAKQHAVEKGPLWRLLVSPKTTGDYCVLCITMYYLFWSAPDLRTAYMHKGSSSYTIDHDCRFGLVISMSPLFGDMWDMWDILLSGGFIKSPAKGKHCGTHGQQRKDQGGVVRA